MVDFQAGKQTGYLITHEWVNVFTPNLFIKCSVNASRWPFYVFDSVPIVLSTYMLNYYHPAKYLPAQKGTLIDGTQAPAVTSQSWFRMGSRNKPAPLSGNSTLNGWVTSRILRSPFSQLYTTVRNVVMQIFVYERTFQKLVFSYSSMNMCER